ncbi:ABC transporter substrate-binding protein [Streptosporangium sp. NPDC004631]
MHRKSFKGVTLLLAAAVALAGCGADVETDGGNGKVELSFANWQWLEPGRGDRLWKSMLEYEKVNPKVSFKKVSATRAEYEKTVQTQMGAGGGPDVLIVPPALLHQLEAANLLVPLEGVADDPHIEKETLKGKRLVYTWEVVNFGFFWNKKLLAQADVKPPTDMAGLLTAASAITKKTGKPGFAVRTSTAELNPWWADFASWPYGFGGGWSKDGKLTINDPKNVEAVTALKKLYASGAMPIGDDASTFRSRFANGEIGMMFDNASVLFTILAGNKELTSEDIGVATLPFPTDNSSQITNFVGVNKNSKHQAEAMGFIKWLGSQEGQKASAEGVFPTLNATAAAPPDDVAAEYPWIKVYREQAKSALGSPFIPGFELSTPQISTVVMKAIESVLVNNQDPATALDQAQKAAEAVQR